MLTFVPEKLLSTVVFENLSPSIAHFCRGLRGFVHLRCGLAGVLRNERRTVDFNHLELVLRIAVALLHDPEAHEQLANHPRDLGAPKVQCGPIYRADVVAF